MTMVDILQSPLPEGAFQGLRVLGGNNNNNNNQNNQNNNNQNNNNYNNNNQNYQNYSSYDYDPFNSSLFMGTAIFCFTSLLFVIIRIRCNRRKQSRRKRLGLSPASRKNKSADGDVITDEEIRRYIRPGKQEQSMQEAARVVYCDRETARIMDICRPFWFQAAVSGTCSVVITVLLGKVLGVDALAIYYIVTVPTTITDTVISAVLETVSSLGGQAIGVGSYKLSGQYCQISIILYTILFIPHVLLWVTYLKPTLRWFAPDISDEVIEEGYNYFLVGLAGSYFKALSTVLHSLLEVMDHYNYCMKSSVAGEITVVIGFISYLMINPHAQKSIVWLGVILSIQQLVFLVIDLIVTKQKKWFDFVWRGIFRSVAMRNWEAVWLVLKTAAPLSVGNILLTIEWELLAIFAARMGETYVAAWGVIGTIWGILEYATDCVASAGEIRVAKLLGNGNPRLAKLSSYKCMFLGNFYASLMSIGFLYGMPYIPAWFSDDEFLNSLVANVLPYCAIGNLTLTMGSLSWTLVGAQGRYSHATYNGCVGSVGVTIPFAALSTYHLNLGLPGLASAVVVGYMISGGLNSMTLFLSDWEYISYRVMTRNGATEPVEEDEEEDEISGWGLVSLFNKKVAETFIDDDSIKTSNNKSHVLINNLDESMSVSSKDSRSTSSSRGSKKSRSWWSGAELDYADEDEVREIVIGPGRLGHSIQSTEQGPMVVGISTDGPRANILQGEFYLGDIIMQVDDTPTDRMSGRQLATLFHKLCNQPSRTILVSHREGMALSTVYQPGPYGSAAIAGVIENVKGMNDDKGEYKAADGGGYWPFK